MDAPSTGIRANSKKPRPSHLSNESLENIACAHMPLVRHKILLSTEIHVPSDAADEWSSASVDASVEAAAAAVASDEDEDEDEDDTSAADVDAETGRSAGDSGV